MGNTCECTERKESPELAFLIEKSPSKVMSELSECVIRLDDCQTHEIKQILEEKLQIEITTSEQLISALKKISDQSVDQQTRSEESFDQTTEQQLVYLGNEPMFLEFNVKDYGEQRIIVRRGDSVDYLMNSFLKKCPLDQYMIQKLRPLIYQQILLSQHNTIWESPEQYEYSMEVTETEYNDFSQDFEYNFTTHSSPSMAQLIKSVNQGKIETLHKSITNKRSINSALDIQQPRLLS